MTKIQEIQIETIKKLHPNLELAKTPREEEFYFACLVMKLNYKKYLDKRYLTGGRRKFVESLKWFFERYKDDIKEHSDYFVLDSDRAIIATNLETNEEILCKNTEQACKTGNCCEKSLTEILAGRKEKCRGWTYRYAEV